MVMSCKSNYFYLSIGVTFFAHSSVVKNVKFGGIVGVVGFFPGLVLSSKQRN